MFSELCGRLCALGPRTPVKTTAIVLLLMRHVRRSDNPKRELVPTGQKLGPTMTGLGNLQACHLRRLSSGCRNPIQRPVAAGREQDRTVVIPCSTTVCRRVGQRLHHSRRKVDALELLIGDEADRLAVSGPERVAALFRSRQRSCSLGIERTDPRT